MRCVGSLCAGLVLFAPSMGEAAESRSERSFEQVSADALMVYDLPETLRPFVATCARETDPFRRLFCEALNERLKAQHQARLYEYTVEPGPDSALVASFSATPKPGMELSVRGCLTCKAPLQVGDEAGEGRFFVFKLPERAIAQPGKGGTFDLGDLTIEKTRVDLPEKMTAEQFAKELEPELRLDLLYRPVAGVTTVGPARQPIGFVTFELEGYRLYHRCTGQVYLASPPARGKVAVDPNDLSCPQNRRDRAEKQIRLPSRLPQKQVREEMKRVGADLHACYDQFGQAEDVVVDLLVTPDGHAAQVRLVGALAGTPAGECVVRLVSAATFPPFAGRAVRVQWPFKIAP